MLKNSGTQEKKQKHISPVLHVPFLAINKLRLSAYAHTPSGIPKLKFWLSLLIPKLFSYPLKKVKATLTVPFYK